MVVLVAMLVAMLVFLLKYLQSKKREKNHRLHKNFFALPTHYRYENRLLDLDVCYMLLNTISSSLLSLSPCHSSFLIPGMVNVHAWYAKIESNTITGFRGAAAGAGAAATREDDNTFPLCDRYYTLTTNDLNGIFII